MSSIIAAAIDPRDRLAALRSRYIGGAITLEQFEAELEPLLKVLPWR